MKKIVCYWQAEMSASLIDANICTHIIYSFLGVDAHGELNHLWRSESEGRRLIKELVALKRRNGNLKVIAAVGGYNPELAQSWSTMSGSSSYRSNFARNVLEFLQRNNLDGIDIDWEYPNESGDKPHEKRNFVLLLEQLKQTLGRGFSVSAAIGAGEWRAALYRSSADDSPSNVHESVQFLLNQGINKDKLIMGIPTYGNAFKLANAASNGVGTPASGAGNMEFTEISQNVQSGKYTYRWDDSQKVPYAFGGTFWVGYDDVRSVREKANYIKSKHLGGAMFWSLDNDDYNGVCGSGKFPLISTVSNIVL